MFENKTVALSGNNKTFNQLFMKRFYEKTKEIRVITDDIFDKTYDELPKVKLYSNQDTLDESLKGVDYLYHFISEELKEYSTSFSFREDKRVMVSDIIKASILSHTKRVLFISDGTTTLANDKMIKNLVVKSSTSLLQKRNKTTSVNYVLAKGYANFDELLDFSLFATKTGTNGDVFVKKTDEKVSFSNKLKNLLLPKTKIERDRESFLMSGEMSRAVDYGQYIKIPLDIENIPYQRFEDRLNSLKVDIKELEKA